MFARRLGFAKKKRKTNSRDILTEEILEVERRTNSVKGVHFWPVYRKQGCFGQEPSAGRERVR